MLLNLEFYNQILETVDYNPLIPHHVAPLTTDSMHVTLGEVS